MKMNEWKDNNNAKEKLIKSNRKPMENLISLLMYFQIKIRITFIDTYTHTHSIEYKKYSDKIYFSNSLCLN
jgi:hypothetical protein